MKAILLALMVVAVAGGIHADKLQRLQEQPIDRYAHLHAHKHEIHKLGHRLREALAMQEGIIGDTQAAAGDSER